MKPFIHSSIEGPQNYSLQAVVLHRGSESNGHYTCISRCRNGSKWLCFDDESVREVHPEDLINHNAYVLVYEKKDRRN
jgi:ubiquitin C-terminal hydrolase